MRSYLPSLSQKVAIVTGSGHGIGQGIAELLAEQGAVVVVSDRRGDPAAEQRAQDVAGGITANGQQAVLINCDLGVEYDIEYLVAETIRQCGRIDVLVNNVFHWDDKTFADQNWDGLRRYAEVNFMGTSYLTQLVAQHMRSQKNAGSIMFITSVHQENVRRVRPWYSVGKAGLAMLVKELAVEYGPSGIRVNGVAPGHIETDDAKVAAGKRTDNPYIPLLGKSGLPEDIAKAVVFLASADTAGFISGATVFVDGGERLYTEWVDRMPP